jgi:hypothetical protein
MFNALRFMSLTAVGELLFGALAFAQTFEVKDERGSVVLTIRTIKMFRDSGKDDSPVFEAAVKNVSGQALTLEALKGTVHKKDGSTVEFVFSVCDVRWCEFPTDSVRNVNHLFANGSYTPATFDSVTFSLTWQSESQRIAAEAQERKDAAAVEAEAVEAQAAEARAKKDAAEAARLEQLEAAERARVAEAKQIALLQKSVSPGFLGEDIRTAVATLARSSPGPKSEFETTAQYEARVASFMARRQQYVFVNNPTADALRDAPDSDCEHFKYNADEQMLTRTVSLFTTAEGAAFELKVDIMPTGQYVATNAFGVRKLVRRFEKNVYELRVTKKPEFFEEAVGGGEWLLKIKLPMRATEAMVLKSTLRIVLVCTVSEPDIRRGQWRTEATITEPSEVHVHTKGLPVRIDKLFVFDRRTGRIMALFGGVSSSTQ